ncbi:MAG TPA: hypothetical protein VLN57_01115 [Xanthobacteraceae bacterium]|nr:hypothetical protein [Xanthobacteraceae bacterium]
MGDDSYSYASFCTPNYNEGAPVGPLSPNTPYAVTCFALLQFEKPDHRRRVVRTIIQAPGSNGGREKMASAEQEKIWDAEFEKIGETARTGLKSGNSAQFSMGA